MVAISRAPYEKLAAYTQRMGWTVTWVSSSGTDFNFDDHVSFTPEEMAKGVSVFCMDADGAVFHTYAAYARGLDMLNVAYHYLDLVPRGRDEAGRGQFWVRRHDAYGRDRLVDPRSIRKRG